MWSQEEQTEILSSHKYFEGYDIIHDYNYA